jgi:hypothetical protein
VYLCGRSNPALLELAFASGLENPPHYILALHSVRDFSLPCQHWLAEFFNHKPLSLKAYTRITIRRCLGNTILYGASRLNLPKLLENYITFSDASLLDDTMSMEFV